MKKLYLHLFIGATCLLLSQTLHAQVYTPKGTNVTAVIYNEFSSADIAYANAYYDAAYPNAQRLADASAKYNCFAYAWYLTEAPGSPRYWINDPSYYWQDGSYIQVCNESDAVKVDYTTSVHGAITSSIAGKYDSKWGQAPLMRHDPTYTPYPPSVRNYYVPTNINASASSICGNTTFSVKSFTGGSYTWSSSSNITLNTTSGPSVIATSSYVGTGTIQVTITSPCSNTPVTTVLPVTVGYPATGNYVSSSQQKPLEESSAAINPNFASGNTVQIAIDYIAGTTNTFSLQAGQSHSLYQTGPNTASLYFNTNYGGNNADVYVTNSGAGGCGAKTSWFSFYYTSDYDYMLAPNPASSELTVSQDKMSESETKTTNTQAKATNPPPFAATLYDKFGQRLKAQEGTFGKTVFNVQDLPNGLYTLRIEQGKKVVTKHIQIQH